MQSNYFSVLFIILSAKVNVSSILNSKDKCKKGEDHGERTLYQATTN